LGIAFVIGIVSTLSFSRIQEPSETGNRAKTQPGFQLPIVPPGGLRAHPDFLAFCAVALLWNGALGVASPFFGVYMVENLGASAGTVGTLSVISAMAALPGQRLFGTLADRWGPRRIQLFTGLIIPLVPWGWALARSPWHLVPIDLIAGFLWAGYSLASFNFLLLLAPEERRSRYTALYQIAVMVALASGSALGGVVATAWGIRAVFVLSGIARLAAALLFVRLVRQPRDEHQARYSVPGRKTRHKRQRYGAIP
jgi:predicted MFS family arabinose efflux permease